MNLTSTITFYLLFLVLIIYFFGFLINAIVRIKYRIIGMNKIESVFAFVGIVVHEISHYFVCKVFRFKVVETQLFTKDLTSYSGHVSFEISENNKFKNIGLTLVSIAPMISGVLFLLGLFVLLLGTDGYLDIFGIQNYDTTIGYGVEFIYNNILTLISNFDIVNPIHYLVLFFYTSLSMYMTLSVQDIKNSNNGMIKIIIGAILIDLLLYILNISSFPVIQYFNYMANILIVSYVISVVFVSFNALISIGFYRLFRIKY